MGQAFQQTSSETEQGDQDDMSDQIKKVTKQDIDVLVNSINTKRLGNFPIKLSKSDLTKIYSSLFEQL